MMTEQEMEGLGQSLLEDEFNLIESTLLDEDSQWEDTSEQQAILAPTDPLLLNCLQRLDGLEALLQVFLATLQQQIQHLQVLQVQQQAIAAHVTDLGDRLTHLKSITPKSPVTPVDLKSIEDHLIRLTPPNTPKSGSWQLWVGGTALATIILVLYTGLVLRPTYLTLQQTLTQQQQVINQLFICMLNPNKAICKALRKSTIEDKQQRKSGS